MNNEIETAAVSLEVQNTQSLSAQAPPADLETQNALAFLGKLREFTITTQAELEWLDGVVKTAKKQGKDLYAQELKITHPLNKVVKDVRDFFRPRRNAYAEIESAGKSKIAEYLAVQEQLKAEAYAHGVSALQAGQAQEGAQALAIAAQAHATEQPQGTSVRYVWEATVDRPELVPRELCSPDPAKIREYLGQWPVDQAAPEIPGLSIARKPIVSMRS